MKRQNKSNKNWSHKHDYPEEEIWQTGHLMVKSEQSHPLGDGKKPFTGGQK